MRLFRRRDDKGRPIGPWHAQFFDAEGVRHEKSTRAFDKKAAEDIARQWERDAADPDHAASRSATLSDALDLLLRDRSSKVLAGKRSEETVKFYRRKAGHVVRLFEQPDVAKARVPFLLKTLRPKHVDDFIDQRRIEGAGEHTIHKEITTLRAALKLAKRRDMWFGDVDAIIPPGFSPEYKPRERNLPMPEVERLLRELSPERGAVVAFIVATSAEWRAVERALCGDVSADASFVLLRGTKVDTRHRTVPIVSPGQRTLLRYATDHAEKTADGPMFLPWKNVRRDLRTACLRAGCRATGCLDDGSRVAPCTRAD
ncbi:MAG: hypothetical protein WCJ30_11265, partial [Deltaproteobacteria bacterium]